MRFLVAIAILVLGAGACSSPDAPATANPLIGFWSATSLTVDGRILEAGILSDSAGALSGCLLVGEQPDIHPFDRTIVALAGTERADSVTLEVPDGYVHTFSFAGVMAGDSLSGTAQLDGSGAQPVVFARSMGTCPTM